MSKPIQVVVVVVVIVVVFFYKNIRSKKCWIQKNFGSKKNLSPKKF